MSNQCSLCLLTIVFLSLQSCAYSPFSETGDGPWVEQKKNSGQQEEMEEVTVDGMITITITGCVLLNTKDNFEEVNVLLSRSCIFDSDEQFDSYQVGSNGCFNIVTGIGVFSTVTAAEYESGEIPLTYGPVCIRVIGKGYEPRELQLPQVTLSSKSTRFHTINFGEIVLDESK